MLKSLFNQQRSLLDFYFKNLDLAHAEAFLEMITPLKGTLFFSGVGKSGLVAKKIATTMTSASMRALYVSPLDALHGDIGILSKDDLFIILSRSGESDELLHLIPYLRNKGVKLVAWVSKPGSRLGKAVDFEILLPFERELCPFDLMPTISSEVQLLFGDLITVALLAKRGITLEEYQKNHPAGRIGRRITLKVTDLMLKDHQLPLAHGADLLIDKLVELSDKRSGCLIIISKEGKFEGIFTDGDLRRSLVAHGENALRMPLEKLMTKGGRSIPATLLAIQAMEIMEQDQKRPITSLPVLDECGRVIGLIRMHDILQTGIS